MIRLIISHQFTIGLLLGVCLFAPWDERRKHFVPRAAVGTPLLIALEQLLRGVVARGMAMLLVQVVLSYLLVRACFSCGRVHAVFTVTCAYTVQHITSKLSYMVVIPVMLLYGRPDDWVVLVLLALVNAAVCVPLFLYFTRHVLGDGRLLFNSVRTVVFSALFLVAAIYLSSVLEANLDSAAPTYLTSYLALNSLCVLLAVATLSLELTNCSVERLESEKNVLERLLEKDRLEYERAKGEMERINIRYHDLKQQYASVSADEQTRLEGEMRSLTPHYFTGNKALDVVLSQKTAACEQGGITLVCSADGEALTGMRSYHVYSLFGNALDNAIECLASVDDQSKRMIYLGVGRKGDMVVIRVENYTPADPVIRDGSLQTTKADVNNHGYGVKSIRNVAETYGGSADTFVMDHVFFLVVTMPAPPKSRTAS